MNYPYEEHIEGKLTNEEMGKLNNRIEDSFPRELYNVIEKQNERIQQLHWDVQSVQNERNCQRQDKEDVEKELKNAKKALLDIATRLNFTRTDKISTIKKDYIYSKASVAYSISRRDLTEEA